MTSVDVFVPNYNYGRFLRACVESVLSQEDVELRVLILDDASSDESEEIGRELARRDRRVEYRRHTVNRGHIATYNEGIEWAAADCVQLLSADDMLTPGSLARAARVMNERPEVTLVYGSDLTFTTDVPPFETPVHWGYHVLGYERFVQVSCECGHTPIQAPTAIVRTSTQKRVGGFRPEHPHSGDTEIWLRLAACGAVGVVGAAQAFRRLHPSSMSCDYSPVRRLEEHLRAFDTHFDEHGGALANAGHLRERVHASLARQAFWLGSEAFDRGEVATCETCLAFAAAAWPSIRSTAEWSRLVWKRRVGPAAWRVLRPVSRLVRGEPLSTSVAGYGVS